MNRKQFLRSLGALPLALVPMAEDRKPKTITVKLDIDGKELARKIVDAWPDVQRQARMRGLA